MRYTKQKLLAITRKIEQDRRITPQEIEYILSFEKKADKKRISNLLLHLALPLSLALGFFVHVYPDAFEQTANSLPSWTNLSETSLMGVDYLWDIVGEPVGKANILYHLPNIVLYSFGILGVKKVIDAIEKKNWLDRVLAAQKIVQEDLTNGTLQLSMKKGHSILFVGKGDFIGAQLTLNHTTDATVTISETKPLHTNTWNYYSTDTMYENLKNVLIRSDAESAGEYVFFPVKDDQIFLPGPTSYDLSAHRLDILCQDIRTIEKEMKWKPKRIILVGDRNHKSLVQSEDKNGVVAKSRDTISLLSISQKYKNVTLLDPSDIVLSEIIKIADGRKIVFRATQGGIKEYKERFFMRLDALGYKQQRIKKGVLTIGYDIFEDQTEQQMLSRKIDDYFPVVLSKAVYDALIRNGYKKSEFIYVPELVLAKLTKTTSEQ